MNANQLALEALKGAMADMKASGFEMPQRASIIGYFINRLNDNERDAAHQQAAAITVESAITQLVEVLCKSKGWMHAYADATVRDAVDRVPKQADIAQPVQPPQQDTVPKGWQLVPIEPTQEMCEAAWGPVDNWIVFALQYRAALEAAPQLAAAPGSTT